MFDSPQGEALGWNEEGEREREWLWTPPPPLSEKVRAG